MDLKKLPEPAHQTLFRRYEPPTGSSYGTQNTQYNYTILTPYKNRYKPKNIINALRFDRMLKSLRLTLFFLSLSVTAAAAPAAPRPDTIVLKNLATASLCPDSEDGSACLMTWENAKSYCTSEGGRLPSVEEYKNHRKNHGYDGPGGYRHWELSNKEKNLFWTSNPHPYMKDVAFHFSGSNGYIGAIDTSSDSEVDNKAAVRCAFSIVVIVPKVTTQAEKNFEAALKAQREKHEKGFEDSGKTALEFGGGAIDVIMLNLRGGVSFNDHAVTVGVQALGTYGLYGASLYSQLAVPGTSKRLYVYGQGVALNVGPLAGGGMGYRHPYKSDFSPSYNDYIAHEPHSLEPLRALEDYEVYKKKWIKKYGLDSSKTNTYWYLELGAFCEINGGCIPTVNFGAMGYGDND